MSPDHDPVVYYAATEYGGIVKIGTTVNLGRRMAVLSKKKGLEVEVLATEPGTYQTEAVRHAQFAHLKFLGEWHWLGADLRAHIDSLRGAL